MTTLDFIIHSIWFIGILISISIAKNKIIKEINKNKH